MEKKSSVRCIKTYKQLEGICQEGDILTMTVVLHDEDVIEPDYYRRKESARHKMHPSPSDIECIKGTKIIQHKGYLKDLYFTTEDGRSYNSDTLRNSIGYFQIDQLFEKIDG